MTNEPDPPSNLTRPWVVSEAPSLMLMVELNHEECFLFDYNAVFAIRKGNEFAIKFGPGTVNISVLSEKLPLRELVEGIRDKRILSITADDTISIEVALAEDDEDAPSPPE